MGESGTAVIIALIAIIIFSYTSLGSFSTNSDQIGNRSNTSAPQQTNQPIPSQNQTYSNQACNYPPAITCQCIPASSQLVSCKNYSQCPTGVYFRTLMKIDQPNVGCIVNTTGGLVTYINDPRCVLNCP